MQNIYTRLGLGIGLAALVVLGVVYLRPATTPLATNTNLTASTTVTNLGNGVSVETTEGTKIEAINDSVPVPSTSGTLVFSANLPTEAVSILRTKEQATISAIKKEPTRVDLWLELGVYRKMAGDYQGAADAWSYVAQTGPTSVNYIAYGNLGDLYMNFLKNYPKAEANFKAAIAIKPGAVDYYRALFSLYTDYGYKSGTSAAADIVVQGLKANPGDAVLLGLQAQLKK